MPRGRPPAVLLTAEARGENRAGGASGGAAASPPRSHPHKCWRGTTLPQHTSSPRELGGQELGKILAGGQTPSPQSSPEPPCDGNPAAPPGAWCRAGPEALCSLRTACSLLQHFSWLANHPQHLPGPPGELSQMPARRGARPHVSQLLALLHEPSAPLCTCFPHPRHQPRCFGHGIFSLHLFCSSFHCIGATSVDARRFLTAPALLLR